ncbi:MAG: hypothetical protein ACTSPV_18420, partial [Candidatus Hodarchaeales archaeon]
EGIIIGYEPQTKTICLDAEKYWGWQVTDLMEAIKKKYQTKHAMLIFLADNNKDKGTKYKYYYDKTNEALAVKGEKWEWYKEEWAEEYCRHLGKKHPQRVIESLQWLVKEGIVKEITIKGMKILPKKDYLLGVSEEGEIRIYENAYWWLKPYLPAGQYPEGKNYVLEKMKDTKGEIEQVIIIIPKGQEDKKWGELEEYEIKTLDEWLEEIIAEFNRELESKGLRLEIGEIDKEDEYCGINVIEKDRVVHTIGLSTEATPVMVWNLIGFIRDGVDEVLLFNRDVKGTNWEWHGEGFWLTDQYCNHFGVKYPERVVESLKWLVKEGIVEEIKIDCIKIVPEKEYLLSASESHSVKIYEIQERLPLEREKVGDRLYEFYKVKNQNCHISYVMKLTPICKGNPECKDLPEYEVKPLHEWVKEKFAEFNKEMEGKDLRLELVEIEFPKVDYVINMTEKGQVIHTAIIGVRDVPGSILALVEKFSKDHGDKTYLSDRD